ncbi:MAG: CRTAC1 family protein, partial [Flavobacteriaceae bacterium]|nr:CRTAC1 family protein [Flavobacteriaceae bacterium]
MFSTSSLSSKFLSILATGMLLIGCNDKEAELSSTAQKTNTSVNEAQVFQKIPTSQSNIDFSNTLTEDVGSMDNLFDFDYFYNGAGVGIEDINNDGLKDIFFAGNQVPNRLYLNKGNLVFEDISESANINVNKQWANGVTFADVNQDGWMDIYVSQGGPRRSEDRGNLLYINQGDLTFKEIGAEVGLNDTGISTQSVFFDYDHDGDLDCFVSNENEFYGLDPKTFYYQMEVKKENLLKSSTHLYRNDGGTFKNVSEEAGVLEASFGLGLTVGDIDNDGWEDIYVANDYYAPDVLYINNHDGTFRNATRTYLNQVSFYGMGVDIADINNDQLQDIFVLDMAASDHIRSKTLMASMNVDLFNTLVDEMEMPHQYMYNSLQLNVANDQFQNIAHLSGVAKTDWSWAGLLVDFDLDGYKDIYVTNGYRRYGSDNDSKTRINEAKRAYNGKVPLDIKQRLYDALPSEKLSNVLFENDKDLKFVNQTNQWGLTDPSFSNGASVADLDNDGDLDIVVNNIDENAFLYKNNTRENKSANFLKVITEGKTSESFAKVYISLEGSDQMVEVKRVRGYLSSLENAAYFGLGKAERVDNIRVEWPSGKYQEKKDVAANSIVTFNEADATITISKEKQAPLYFEKEVQTRQID